MTTYRGREQPDELETRLGDCVMSDLREKVIDRVFAAIASEVPITHDRGLALSTKITSAALAYIRQHDESADLHTKLADCQAVIRHKGHDVDCPASSSACAICGLHELLHPCVTYFGDSQKHNFNRGPCSDDCGHDRTTGEKV